MVSRNSAKEYSQIRIFCTKYRYRQIENNKQVENLGVISDEDQIQIQFYYADGSNEEIFVDIS